MRRHVAALAVLGLGLALLVPVALPPEAAYALSVPGGGAAQYALSVPGTVLTGAAGSGVTGTYTEAELAALLANKVRYSWGWSTDAALSKLSGNTTISPPPSSGLTTSQLAQLDQIQAGFAAPATKLATVAKTVGGVVTAVTVGTTGVALGVAVDQAFGVDVSGGLCSGGGFTGINAVLAGITGTDCQKWQMSQALQSAPNSDVPAGVAGGPACDSAGVCYQLAGTVAVTYTISTLTETDTIGCISFSGTAPTFQTDSAGNPFFPQASSSSYGVLLQRSDATWGAISVVKASTYKLTYNGVSSYPFNGKCASDWIIRNANTSTWPWATYGYGLYSGTTSGSWEPSTTTTPQTATAAPTNPSRQFKCVITMTDSTTATAYTANFTEGGSTTIPSPVCPAVPPGEVPATTTIYETSPTGDLQLYQTATTPEYQNWKTTYPECANGSCLLDLQKSGVSCFQDPGPCDGWMTDPNRDTLYTCVYGTHTMPLSQCYVYAPTFTPSRRAAGNAYADPATGNSTGTQNTPVENGAMDQPVQSPGTTPRQCWPTGWGVFNPLAWIYQPAVCAMQWAFVPRQTVVDSTNNQMKAAVNASAVGSVLGIITGINSFPITGSGCSGIPWHFAVYGLVQDYNILAACPGDPLQPTAAAVKGVLTVIVWTAAVFAWARYIASIFGYVGYGASVDAQIRDQRYHETKAGGGVKFK